MKRIKGAYEVIKLRYLLCVFAAVALVALPLRVYQLLALVDPATGFYTESNGTVYLLSALLVLSSANNPSGAMHLSRIRPNRNEK